MQNIIQVSFILMLFNLSSCFNWKSVTGKDPVITENRSVAGFSKIDFSGDGDLTIVKGDVFKVEVSDYANLLPYLETGIVDGDKLKIAFRSHLSVTNSKLKVVVHMPLITKASLSGDGLVKINMPNSTPGELKLYVSGDGKILTEAVSTGVLTVNISGNGHVNIPKADAVNASYEISGDGIIQVEDGSAEKLRCFISGNAKIDACKMRVRDATVVISGDGITSTHTTNTITGSISGDGLIYLLGKPEVQEVKISGGGKVKMIDNCLSKY
jgi:hypothetical protein